MGIVIKKRDSTEYLYVLAGNLQYFLGRKDDPDSINIKNLCKAAGIIDQNFDRTMTKYLTDMQERIQYMPKQDAQKYVADRLEKISSMLEQTTSKTHKSIT